MPSRPPPSCTRRWRSAAGESGGKLTKKRSFGEEPCYVQTLSQSMPVAKEKPLHWEGGRTDFCKIGFRYSSHAAGHAVQAGPQFLAGPLGATHRRAGISPTDNCLFFKAMGAARGTPWLLRALNSKEQDVGTGIVWAGPQGRVARVWSDVWRARQPHRLRRHLAKLQFGGAPLDETLPVAIY